METCLRQFATVANSRNSKGNAKVAICKPFPVAYSREDRNLHLFASPSNSRPMRAAQPRRVTCAEHRGRSTRSEWPQNRKINHPRPRLMDASRVDGVKAPPHDGTPRSYASMFISRASNCSSAGRISGVISYDLGVPRCRGAFTPSTRFASIRRGRGWFNFRFEAIRTE